MSPEDRLTRRLRRLAGDKRLLERRLRHAEVELECLEALLNAAIEVIRELGGFGEPAHDA